MAGYFCGLHGPYIDDSCGVCQLAEQARRLKDYERWGRSTTSSSKSDAWARNLIEAVERAKASAEIVTNKLDLTDFDREFLQGCGISTQ